MMTIATSTDLQDHAATRPHGHQIVGSRMIGRITAGEFDLIDAIVVNQRAGVEPRLTSIARTLCIDPESLSRRLFRAREVGLIVMREVDLLAVGRGAFVPVNAYFVTQCGATLFREALQLMDQGLAAA